MALYAAILAGGVGTRMWPRSRQNSPKQFLNLTGDETMLQTAVRRILPLVDMENIFILTGERYVSLVQEQLPALPATNIIAEPSGKNTAPAIGLGALHIAQRNPNGVMAVLTADHIIPNENIFRQTLSAAAETAAAGRLVTLGIVPTGPETGYGYIHRGKLLAEKNGASVYQVDKFLEKPDYPTANKFFESGEYYWNSGMFIWQVKTLFQELETHMPVLAKQLQPLGNSLEQNDSTAFRSCPETTSHIYK